MPSARELIEKARAYTTSLREAVSAAKEAHNIISVDIRNANNRLEYKESSFYPNTFATQYAKSMITDGIASRILSAAIERAADQSEEFSRGIYKNPMLVVAKDLDIFRITVIGNGWNSRLSVIIIFESSAGSISDWAHGIMGYRDELGVKVGNEESNRGFRATNWWSKRVYKTALEVETINGRLAIAGRPAPFWQILNNGSTSLPSDRPDGSFNPVLTSPSDFIGEAEAEITSHFKIVLSSEKAHSDAEIRFLKDSISDAYEVIGEIERLIDKLKADENLDRFIIEELNSRAKSGDISEYVDRDKLMNAVKKARAGEDLTKSRIELTAKKAAKRVRPRRETFIRLVEGFEEL